MGHRTAGEESADILLGHTQLLPPAILTPTSTDLPKPLADLEGVVGKGFGGLLSTILLHRNLLEHQGILSCHGQIC